MRSKTSWFNGTLFKKNLTRFWPVWTLYLAIWTFAMPVYLLAQVSRYAPGEYSGYESALRWFADSQIFDMLGGAVIASLVFGVLAAMAVFSYLYHNRSAGMLHALPVRREGLFLTNYLSGLVFLAGPAVLVFLLTLGAEAIVGAVNAGALCMWLVVHLLLILFFYSFAVFCAMFTGNLLALPAFYGILNLLVFGLYNVVVFMLDQLLFGYWREDWLQELTNWLTPVMALGRAITARREWNEVTNMVTSVTFEGLTTALLYGAVGVLLAAAALVLYRKKHLETAGDVIAVSWIKPVFRYGVGVCAALAGGTLLYAWFGRGILSEDVWLMLLFLLPCGAIGYFAAEMLINKSFRAFGHWKGCLVMLAAVVLCVGAVRLDIFGYGSELPEGGEVEMVHLGVGGAAPHDQGRLGGYDIKDREYIQAVLDLHAAIVAERAAIERGWEAQTGPLSAVGDSRGEAQTFTVTSCRIEYQRTDGTWVRRLYELPISAEALEDPASYAAQLQNMDRFSAVNLKNYGFPTAEENTKLVTADIQVYNTETGEYEQAEIPDAGLEALLAAVKSDLLAGRLGQRFLLDDAERMNSCYQSDINFGFFDLEDSKNMDVTAAKGSDSSRVTITPLVTAADTLAELRALGVLDETHVLLTQAEALAREENLQQDAAAENPAEG